MRDVRYKSINTSFHYQYFCIVSTDIRLVTCSGLLNKIHILFLQYQTLLSEFDNQYEYKKRMWQHVHIFLHYEELLLFNSHIKFYVWVIVQQIDVLLSGYICLLFCAPPGFFNNRHPCHNVPSHTQSFIMSSSYIFRKEIVCTQLDHFGRSTVCYIVVKIY